jgi:hypothetical protein
MFYRLGQQYALMKVGFSPPMQRPWSQQQSPYQPFGQKVQGMQQLQRAIRFKPITPK